MEMYCKWIELLKKRRKTCFSNFQVKSEEKHRKKGIDFEKFNVFFSKIGVMTQKSMKNWPETSKNGFKFKFLSWFSSIYAKKKLLFLIRYQLR